MRMNPVWQTLLARGSLERVLDAAVAELDESMEP